MSEKELVERAKAAMEHAYAPYSGFSVGAALLTQDGHVFTGCNIENSSYGAAICGERSAVCAAVSAGYRDFSAIAIASSGEETVYPCGICRQVLGEFSKDMKVICVTGSTEEYEVFTLSDLFPRGFSF